MTLDYQDLISNSLKIHVEKMKNSGEEETITFYIEDYKGEMSINEYYLLNGERSKKENSIIINSIGHNPSDKIYIRSIFSKLDKIIDLDFKEMSHNNGSQIDIYSVSSSSSFSNNVIGQVISQETENGAWFDLLWKEEEYTHSETSSLEKSTLIHELGHTLGLSHPKNDPTNIHWTTEDTVMSYNKPADKWSDWFSEKDLSALKSMWGRENDNGVMSFDNEFSNYAFSRSRSKNYFVDTLTGIENITTLKSLKFQDKEVNVSQNIINVFNKLDEIDSITGKIFRLYESSFNRFPDKDGFEYWVHKNSSNENNYRQTGFSFIESEEFQLKYSPTISNSDFITNLYANTFNRLPDQTGFNYWLGQIDQGNELKAEILIGFAESSESKRLFSINCGLNINL